MVKRNADFYLSLQEIPAPDFSDGDPQRHPYQTVPQRSGPINYYRPCYPEEQKTLMWLSKLGTAVYKNAVHSLPSNTSVSDLHARSSPTPSTSATANPSSSTALVLAHPTLAPRTSLPVAPEIPIGAHDEVKFRLVDFPAGYKLFLHTFEVGSGKHHNATIPKGDGTEGRRNIRHDAYLYGHPSGIKFRSPNEFLPHLWWMINDPQHTDCQCLYCGFILPRRRLAIEAKKPEEISPKQITDKESVYGAAAVAALVKGAPNFRVGEIVWAKSKKSFVKIPEGDPAAAFLPSVPLWPAVIHNIHRDIGLPTKYEAILLKLYRDNNINEPRSISVLEERLLPWLAHSPVEPTSADLLTAAHLGIPELAMYREALRQAYSDVQPQYRPFGGYYEPPISKKELQLHLDPATREWMEKQHTYERYAGMWFGTERILCQEVVRMVAASGPEVPSRDPNDDESRFDFFYIRSIFNDPDDGLTVAGDIYRRRRASASDHAIDGFDGEYVWYQASQKVEEFTVGICNIAGRYYHQYPDLHSRMEVKAMAPEADRSVALRLGRSLSYAGPEKEGGAYIRKVLCTPSRATSARPQGTSHIQTRSRTRTTSSSNPRKRRKPLQIEWDPTYPQSQRKKVRRSNTLHVQLDAINVASNIVVQNEDEVSHEGFGTISDNSYGNEIEETIFSPAVEREHTCNSSGNGQEEHVPITNFPSDPISHRRKRSQMQTDLHIPHTNNIQAFYEEQRNGMSLDTRQSVAPKPVAGRQRKSTGRHSTSSETPMATHPTDPSLPISTATVTSMRQTSDADRERQHSIPPTDIPCFDDVESNNVKSEDESEPTSNPRHHEYHYPPPTLLPSAAASASARPISQAAAASSDLSETSPSAKKETKAVTPNETSPQSDSSGIPAVLKWRGKLRMDNLDACDAIGVPLEKSSSGKLVVSDQQRSRYYSPLLAKIPEMLQISMRIPGEHAERYFSKLDQVLSARNCMCLVLTASRLASDWGKTRGVFDDLVQSMKSGGYCGVVKHGGLRMLIKPQDDMLLCLAQFGTDETAQSPTVTTQSTATDAASEGRLVDDSRRANGSPEIVLTQRSDLRVSNPHRTPIVTPSAAPETPTARFAEDAFVRSDRFRNSQVVACVNYADQVSGTVDLSECTSLSLLVHAIGLALGYGDSWRGKRPSDVNLRFMGFDRVMWTVVEGYDVQQPARDVGSDNVTGDLNVVRRFALTLNTVYGG